MKRPLFLVCVLLVIIAALRMLSGRERADASSAGALYAELNGQQLIITGQVCQRDTESFTLEKITLHSTILNTSVASQQQIISQQITDKLLCEYEGEVRIGESVSLTGILQWYEAATNPGEFDARQYYATRRIAGKVRKIELLQRSDTYSQYQEGLFCLKEYFRQRLYHIFPEKEAGVMTAMLLGDKSDLDSELKKLYQENGIIHILSISGVKIQNLAIPLTAETRINRAFVPLHIAKIYILKLCFNEEIIPRCRFPCSRG